LTNPLDLGDIFDIDFYVTVLEMALERDDVDGVVLNHVFQAESELAATQRLARQVEDLSARYHKPVALVLFSSDRAISQVMENISLPIFSEPLMAIEALSVSRERVRYLAAAATPSTPLPVVAQAPDKPLFDEWLQDAARRDKTLFADQALTVLQEYGLPVAPFVLVRHPHELLEEGEELGFPLVLKAVVAGLSHKSDVGGVLTGINNRRALEDVGSLLFERFSSDAGFCGVLVQKEVDVSLEMIVGARRDPSFGDIFLLGLGGIYAEILQDVQIVPGPLSCEAIATLVDRLRGAQILRGARGRDGIDLAQLYKVMAGLQALLHDYPAISEVEINPLVFVAGSSVVVDGRIIVK
jgi:acetyltransferase